MCDHFKVDWFWSSRECRRKQKVQRWMVDFGRNLATCWFCIDSCPSYSADRKLVYVFHYLEHIYLQISKFLYKFRYLLSYSSFLPSFDYDWIFKDLINAAVLEKCKKGVLVINNSRGGIVNEKDLLEALENGRCGGTVIDSFVKVG